MRPPFLIPDPAGLRLLSQVVLVAADFRCSLALQLHLNQHPEQRTRKYAAQMTHLRQIVQHAVTALVLQAKPRWEMGDPGTLYWMRLLGVDPEDCQEAAPEEGEPHAE